MPYVDGQSLRDKLSKEGELPVAEAVRILRDVVEALSHAHKHNVVHRDIKPDNVMLSDRHALVTDFGIAKAVSEATGREQLTTAGVALGTPAYMAPEQAAADPHIDHRADIYAVGAVAYELLTGRPPFTGNTQQEVLAAHVTQTPDPITRYRDSVPSAIERLVMKCLEKKAADRWQSAEELLPQLEALATPSGGVTPTGTMPVSGGDYEAVARRSNPFLVAALFGVGAVVVLAIIYGLMIILGLPDWVMIAGVVLTVLALPVTLLTGHHERQLALERTTGKAVLTPAEGVKSWFVWRRAVRAGLVALGALAVVAASYMAMRNLGIGPFGTLITSGALEERPSLLIAEFINRTSDSTLGATVTEAIRVDLSQSPAIRLMEAADIASALQRMGTDLSVGFGQEIAVEVAEREGVGAVVSGEIAPVGAAYLISARILTPGDGSELVAVRETADGDAELLNAVDQLSAALRERIGESLRSIRASAPLSRVTTTSLEALKMYSESERRAGSGLPDSRLLMEEAATIDSTFAMAYRRLSNLRPTRSGRIDAAKRAFLHSDRLPVIEREMVRANYFYNVEYNPGEVVNSYQRIVALQPDHPRANNNLAVQYNRMRRWSEAERHARVAETGLRQSPFAVGVDAQVAQGKLAAAESTVVRFDAKNPTHPQRHLARAVIAYARGDMESTERFLLTMRDSAPSSGWRNGAANNLAALRVVQGRLIEAERREPPNRWILVWGDLAMRRDQDGAKRRAERLRAEYPLEELDPLDRPYLGLADLYGRIGEPDVAASFLAAYESEVDQTVRERDSFRYGARAAIELARGNIASAVENYRRWYDESRCAACGLYDLARIHERSGDGDSAIAAYERGITAQGWNKLWDDLWGNLPAALKRLGELYEQRGDTDKAVEYYNEFVELWKDADPELQPQVEDVRERIAKLVGER